MRSNQKKTKEGLLREISALRDEMARLKSGNRNPGILELGCQALAESSPHWEYWVNADGTPQYMSPSSVRISGYTPAQFMHDPSLFRKIIIPDDQPIWENHTCGGLGDSNPLEIAFRVRRRDGAIRWIEHSCYAVIGTGGEFLGTRVSNRDVTERKHSDGQLQRSRAELRRLSSRLLSIQEEERKKIARELHDGIGQTLSAVKFSIENALQDADAAGAEGHSIESVKSVIPMIQNAIQEVRRMQTDLRPPILDDLGILPTISWFCREYEKVYSGIHVEREIQVDEKDVPPPLKTAIYRILQEGMNNIAKYSRSDRACIALNRKENGIELIIEDHGLGFDPQEVLFGERERRGFGLISMKERTELAGGSFSIESQKGAGTRVRAVWMLDGSPDS